MRSLLSRKPNGRRLGVLTLVVTAVALAIPGMQATSAGAERAGRPNIVLIMADDLGVEGLNCYGGTSYRTPRLDQLAAEGLRFTQAYAQPLCTNTRVQLMTGLYNHRNWLYFGCLDPNAKTIGHYMQEAGYATCIAGKWQLQSYDPPDYPGADKRRGKGMKVGDAGFDEYSLWHTGHTELKGPRYADPVINENGKFRTDTRGRYGEDVWVEFIRDFMKEHKDGDRPFFVYYPMTLPHWPFVPTPRSDDWGIEEKMHPPLGTTGGDTKYFPDMVAYMDEVVGRVVEAVDDLGLGEKTLILYYADNGTDRRVVSETIFGDVDGGKGSTTDAGTHVPLIVRWKGRIAPGVCDDLIDSTDFLPTVLEAAGRPLGEGAAIDGRSFFPQLMGESGEPREWIFCHFDPQPGWDKDKFSKRQFIRDKRFKLYDDGRLFEVPRDLREEHPLSPETDSEAASAARRKLQQALQQVRKPLGKPVE
ncbi:MAG: sulfatase-like hydrolase/transferase [Pirellulaceae bacterium]